MDRKPIEKEKEGGRYFQPPTTNKFFGTGSTLLDSALGGGWVLGRVGNIVGDSSTGKSLQCIEACANFAQTFKNSPITYREAESAFDTDYAKSLGLPVDRVELNPGGLIDTVEEVFEEMKDFFEKAKKSKEGGLYIIDSLDSLSDAAEMERDFTEGTFGANKAKNIGKLFRMSIREMEASKSTCLIVSQTRANIGATFGQKWTVSGGKALEFYCTQRIILASVGKIKKTIEGIEREIGVDIKAKIFKNKAGDPGREAKFPIIYSYGVDNVASIIEWFEDIKKFELLPDLGSKEGATAYIKALRKLPWDEQDKYAEQLVALAKTTWAEIEAKFKPERRKYPV